MKQNINSKYFLKLFYNKAKLETLPDGQSKNLNEFFYFFAMVDYDNPRALGSIRTD